VAPSQAIQIAGPPGATGAFSWLAATSSSVAGLDNGPSSASNPTFFPLCVQFSTVNLAQFSDIQAMFSEFQIRSMRLGIQSLCSDDWNANSFNSAGFTIPVIPEVMTAVDPNAQEPLPAATCIGAIESYSRVKRTFLTARNKHTVRFVPKVQFEVTPYSVTTSPVSIVFNDRVQDFWYPTVVNNAAGSPLMNQPFFSGIHMVFRNFPSTNGFVASASPFVVRASLEVDIAARRPH
jgi:hypothetical protein